MASTTGVTPSPDEDILKSLAMPLVEPPAPQSVQPEKKPVKKRKSWGQKLPEPKTNLPPRKRAKTDDEKEQRRVERVLRNRRAAQSSRERKRLEAENLEKRNKELEGMVSRLQRSHIWLIETIKQMKANGPDSVDSPALQAALQDPTLGRSVFPTSSEHPQSASLEGMSVNDNGLVTVDPARISPGLAPISECDASEATSAAPHGTPEDTANGSLDLTQHPAAVLCDLQCQSTKPVPCLPRLAVPSWIFLISATTTALSIWTTPMSYLAFSMKAGLPLLPSRSILNLIIWLVTRPRASWTNSSLASLDSVPRVQNSWPNPCSSNSPAPPSAAPSSMRSLPHRSRTLRLKSLKKILTCSPSLARPLADATLEVLRLVSEGHSPSPRTCGNDSSSEQERCGEQGNLPVGWMPHAPLPSGEVLVTLLWALRVEGHRLSELEYSSRPFLPVSSNPPGWVCSWRQSQDKLSSAAKRQWAG